MLTEREIRQAQILETPALKKALRKKARQEWKKKDRQEQAARVEELMPTLETALVALTNTAVSKVPPKYRDSDHGYYFQVPTSEPGHPDQSTFTEIFVSAQAYANGSSDDELTTVRNFTIDVEGSNWNLTRNSSGLQLDHEWKRDNRNRPKTRDPKPTDIADYIHLIQTLNYGVAEDVVSVTLDRQTPPEYSYVD